MRTSITQSGLPTDIRVRDVALYFLPVQTRIPLKFGTETTTSVTCARIRVRVENRKGKSAEGWGETPLSVQWVWPSSVPYSQRHETLKTFCEELRATWTKFDCAGHPMEVGSQFIEHELNRCWKSRNEQSSPIGPMPWLAALVCNSAFDIAVHDAYGVLLKRSTYTTYGPEFMNRDLSTYLADANADSSKFSGKYPQDFLIAKPMKKIPAWHLVGGLDWLDESDLPTGADSESIPKDGYPYLLTEWIKRDGLKCLKVKLRGNDAAWDFERMIRVGRIAIAQRVNWLTADFNCTVQDPGYVNEILDRLRDEFPRIYGMLLYVEQPFPYELDEHPVDVHSVASRKPLFLDESAHDWRMVRRGRELGWTGVALKTCKTQTGALLSLCWAKAHGMTLMVQDLTNPMLAQIPHVLLAAHAGTIMGVETNAMQFYPEASANEAMIHPGLYQRRRGILNLSTIRGPGFGYRVDEIRTPY